jgi:hypothetical protein
LGIEAACVLLAETREVKVIERGEKGAKEVSESYPGN